MEQFFFLFFFFFFCNKCKSRFKRKPETYVVNKCVKQNLKELKRKKKQKKQTKHIKIWTVIYLELYQTI